MPEELENYAESILLGKYKSPLGKRPSSEARDFFIDTENNDAIFSGDGFHIPEETVPKGKGLSLKGEWIPKSIEEDAGARFVSIKTQKKQMDEIENPFGDD